MGGYHTSTSGSFRGKRSQPSRNNGHARNSSFSVISPSNYLRSGSSTQWLSLAAWIPVFRSLPGKQSASKSRSSLSWRIHGITGCTVSFTSASSTRTSIRSIINTLLLSDLLPSTPLLSKPCIFGSQPVSSKLLMLTAVMISHGVFTTSFLSGPAPSTTTFTTSVSLVTTQAVSDGGIISWILRPDPRLQRRDVSASLQRKPRRQRRLSKILALSGCTYEDRMQTPEGSVRPRRGRC